ncbi:hypothetical protein [Bacillus toyonensis]
MKRVEKYGFRHQQVLNISSKIFQIVNSPLKPTNKGCLFSSFSATIDI